DTRNNPAVSARGTAFHDRAWLSDPGRPTRLRAWLQRDRRLPRGAGAAVRAAQRLHLAAQPRSAPGARRRESRRIARPRVDHGHVAAAAAWPGERLVVRGDPFVQRVYRLAVRDRTAHPNAARCALQLRA